MGWLGWVVVIVILWFIIVNPHTAAQDARNIAAFITAALQ